MKAYLGIKYHADRRNRDLIERIARALEANGYETVCVARDVEQWGAVRFAPADLMRETMRVIDASDLVVIDLSEKGVGVGIEAGYAFARQIPVVTIARRGSDISETLRGISRAVFEYAEPEELVSFFKVVAQSVWRLQRLS